MKTIGLIGGTGWLSTLEYYRIINQETNKRLGGLNSAKIFLSSFNYAEIDRLNKVDDHAGVYKLVLDATRKLKATSVDCIVLCGERNRLKDSSHCRCSSKRDSNERINKNRSVGYKVYDGNGFLH